MLKDTTVGIESGQMEGFSVNSDSGIASASSGYELSSNSNSSGGGTASASTSGTNSNNGSEADPEREHHFGPSNPVGPIPPSPAEGRTTKSTTTEEDGRGGIIHTSVYTTVCSSGEAYRTTRVTNSQRLLSATYEKSVPLGTTHRIIRAYHRGTNNNAQPYYDQTTEIVRSGGSTTVKRQKFDMDGNVQSHEHVQEYPPMEITPKLGNSFFGFGGRGGGGSNPNADRGGGDGDGHHNEDITVVSELTNPRVSRPIDVDEQHTLAGIITRYDDPTVDPTVIDYNAGYSEEMAQKHNTMAVGGMIGGMGYDAERALPPGTPATVSPSSGTPSSPASSGRSGRKSWSVGTENYYSRSNDEGGRDNQNKKQGMTTQTKLIIFGTVVLVVTIAIGAAVGTVTARSGGGSNDANSGDGDSGDSADGAAPLPRPCVACSNVRSMNMIVNDLYCDTATGTLNRRCGKARSWWIHAPEPYCQYSCWADANATSYDDYPCCPIENLTSYVPPPVEKEPGCVECSNDRDEFMTKRGLMCDSWAYVVNTQCNNEGSSWNTLDNPPCQYECWLWGKPYDRFQNCCHRDYEPHFGLESRAGKG